MNKNIFKKFNDERINIEEYKIVEVSELEKEKMKKEFRKNISKESRGSFKKVATIAAAALIGFSLLSTDLGHDVYAKAESRLEQVSYSISNALGGKKLASYTNIVESSVEDKGVEIKLSEVIIDRDELILSTIVSFNEEVDGYNFNPKIYVNGKLLETISSSGNYSSSPMEENSYLEISNYRINNLSQEDNLDFKIVIDKVRSYKDSKERTVKGSWEFEFNAGGKELAKDTISYPLDQKIQIGKKILHLKEFTVNPINQKIYADIDKNETKDSYQIELLARDNMGNELVFYNARSEKDRLVFKSEEGSSKVLTEDIEFLEIKPRYTKLPRKSGRVDSSNSIIGETFIINLK